MTTAEKIAARYDYDGQQWLTPMASIWTMRAILPPKPPDETAILTATIFRTALVSLSQAPHGALAIPTVFASGAKGTRATTARYRPIMKMSSDRLSEKGKTMPAEYVLTCDEIYRGHGEAMYRDALEMRAQGADRYLGRERWEDQLPQYDAYDVGTVWESAWGAAALAQGASLG